jgi:hypothetical protein
VAGICRNVVDHHANRPWLRQDQSRLRNPGDGNQHDQQPVGFERQVELGAAKVNTPVF